MSNHEVAPCSFETYFELVNEVHSQAALLRTLRDKLDDSERSYATEAQISFLRSYNAYLLQHFLAEEMSRLNYGYTRQAVFIR